MRLKLIGPIPINDTVPPRMQFIFARCYINVRLSNAQFFLWDVHLFARCHRRNLKKQKKRRIIRYHNKPNSLIGSNKEIFDPPINIELLDHLQPWFGTQWFFRTSRGWRFSTPERLIDAFQTHMLELP